MGETVGAGTVLGVALGKSNSKSLEFATKRVKVHFLKSESESHSVVSDSLRLHGLYSPWNSPGQNTGVGSLSLHRGIFPTQGLNLVSHIVGGFFTS